MAAYVDKLMEMIGETLPYDAGLVDRTEHNVKIRKTWAPPIQSEGGEEQLAAATV